jgi:hypothetical protein
MDDLNGTGILFSVTLIFVFKSRPLGAPRLPVVRDLGNSDAFAFHAGNLGRVEDDSPIFVRSGKGSHRV